MRNSDFDTDSLYIGLSIGAILGIIITALLIEFGTPKNTSKLNVRYLKVSKFAKRCFISLGK